MARLKKQPPPASKSNPKKAEISKAERSAYFARREAAKVMRTVLKGDENKKAVGSIKSLVYSPTVRNKRATFALLVQTLKYLTVIKDVLSSAGILNSKWKRQGELIYIITYDILFGQFESRLQLLVEGKVSKGARREEPPERMAV